MSKSLHHLSLIIKEHAMKKIKTASDYVVDLLQREDWQKPAQPYIKPSSLAKGCLLYVAFELQGRPKPPMDARVGRILSVGTDSHRRMQRGLSRACLTQEVYFALPEYRIHGFVDGILFVPPETAPVPSIAGFWVLEFKTTAGSEFDKVKAAKMPKEDHIRQAQVYLWGLEKYFDGQIPINGALIYYENRDTLEHLAYEVPPDPPAMDELMSRVRKMLAGHRNPARRLSPRRSLGPPLLPVPGNLRTRPASDGVASQTAQVPPRPSAGKYDRKTDRRQKRGGKNDREEEKAGVTVVDGAGTRDGYGVGVKGFEHCGSLQVKTAAVL
jgi:hypothetical protein